MSKFKIRFLVAFLTFGLGLVASYIWLIKLSASSVSLKQEPVPVVQQFVINSPIVETPINFGNDKFRVIIPKSHWEKIFFEDINQRIRSSKLPNLRLKALPKGNLEVRVWRGFGITMLEGFVLKRTNGKWSAMDLGWKTYENKGDDVKVSPSDQKLETPVSGWDVAWQNLTQAGLLTLPDAEEINCSAMVNDGISYVVEYNLDNTYRTYMYDNPEFEKCGEAKRIMEINKIISAEFYKGKFNLNE